LARKAKIREAQKTGKKKPDQSALIRLD